MAEASPLLELLRCSLEGGPISIGQITVHPDYRLHHTQDQGHFDFQVFSVPQDAVEIAKYDDAGNYRPLKTAPNLRHGWLLHLANLEEVRLALDFLYPAALGLWRAHRQGGLDATSLRQTLGRQTGMYAVVKKITDNEASDLMDRICQAGCLRSILWTINSNEEAGTINAGPATVDTARKIPLLCREACNLFIAEGRKVVKGRPASD